MSRTQGATKQRTIERAKLAKEMRHKGFTLQHIGDIMGITKERARQLVNESYQQKDI